MPILEISDGKGSLLPDARETLTARMLYPSDEAEDIETRNDARLFWLYEKYLDHEDEKTDKKVSIQIRDVRRLLFLNPENVRQMIGRAVQKGRIAGRILKTMEMINRSDPGTASVRKAIEACRWVALNMDSIRESILSQLEHDGLRRKAGPLPGEKQSRQPFTNTSETKIREYWSEYKSVAHLWAAESCNLPGFPWGPPSRNSSDFLRFLADADFFREFGENYFARGQRKHQNSTLDPRCTWSIPDDISLPGSPYGNDPPKIVVSSDGSRIEIQEPECSK